MLEKFLKEVVTIIVGKSAEPITDLLYNKKHVNEFIIAKKLNVTINQTRNILYKLSDFGLVSSVRKKDKKKGWYTYFWRMEIQKALEFLKEIKLKQINQISNQINNREAKQFYVCERCNIEVTEESALLHDFTCNECGEIYTSKDNTKLIRDLKRNSEKITKEISFLDEELGKENLKLGKEKDKEKKKEDKIKAKIKEKESRRRKREKNKLQKSMGKKVEKKSKSSKKIKKR